MSIEIHAPLVDRPMECEWCSDKASYKIVDGRYRRYACGSVQHREDVRQLARLDGHNDYDVVCGYFTLEEP